MKRTIITTALALAIATGAAAQEQEPICTAIHNGDKKAFDAIVGEAGFNVNKRYKEYLRGAALTIVEKTAIVDAIDECNLDMVTTLLDKGASADVTVTTAITSSGITSYDPETAPFIKALGNEFNPDNNAIAGMVGAAVKKPLAKYKTNDGSGESADLIELCITMARPEYQQVLIDFVGRNFDVNYTIPVSAQTIKILKGQGLAQQAAYAQKYGGKSLLDLAVIHNRLKLAQWLLEKGAKTDKAGDNGGYLWNYATTLDMVKLLVEHGVDINTCVPGSGYNILQLNIKRMGPKDFEELIKMGADVHHKDAMGKSVLDHAPSDPFVPKDIKKNRKILEKYL